VGQGLENPARACEKRRERTRASRCRAVEKFNPITRGGVLEKKKQLRQRWGAAAGLGKLSVLETGAAPTSGTMTVKKNRAGKSRRGGSGRGRKPHTKTPFSSGPKTVIITGNSPRKKSLSRPRDNCHLLTRLLYGTGKWAGLA